MVAGEGFAGTMSAGSAFSMKQARIVAAPVFAMCGSRGGGCRGLGAAAMRIFSRFREVRQFGAA